MRHNRITSRGLIGRFLAGTDGNFAVLSGVIMATVAMGIGFGINLTQSFHVKSSLRSALDAAVTSTARDITTGRITIQNARPTVEAFLAANADSSFAETGFVLENLVFDPTTRTIEATAFAHVDLAFPLFTTDNPRVAITSAAVYSDKQIEVAMVLDVTGSMRGDKIESLKTAASNAVDTFLSGQDPANPRVRMAIVPYADAVNTGPLANTVHVETRFTEGEPPRLDDPRVVSAPAPDACATERKGSRQFTDSGPQTAMVNRDYRVATCPTAALIPLSSDIDSLKDTIGDFRANGVTAGHIGIQWGWYMLSPKWASVLSSSARPAAYNERNVAKYAIIMTDGEFNTAYAGVSRTGDPRSQASLSRRNAERLCDEMKREGIEVFTVGFMLREAGARAVMRDCATADTSSVRHHFEAATGEELDAAFQAIAGNIERLAITR